LDISETWFHKKTAFFRFQPVRFALIRLFQNPSPGDPFKLSANQQNASRSNPFFLCIEWVAWGLPGGFEGVQ